MFRFHSCELGLYITHRRSEPLQGILKARRTDAVHLNIATGECEASEVQEGPLLIAQLITKAPSELYAPEKRTTVKTEALRRDIATLLASASALRDAIILREILGPSRGLRLLDLV